jgi:predicted RNA binding protein YcfA (HicA-like mRNA interferase family)
LKPVTGKAFARALERNGWTLLRISGSHHIYGKAGVAARISIPVHGNALLKIGLQNKAMRITQLTEEDL